MTIWTRLRCWWKHDWLFRHERPLPYVICRRCGLMEPIPYGDERMRYL